MANSQYLPFATGPGANAIPAASYQLLAATLVSIGFVEGTALSEHVNAVLRQATVGVAALARVGADYGNVDVLDNGDVIAFRDAIVAAIRSIAVGSGVPSGTVTAFAGGSPPAGWLECNGGVISRTSYAALFAAIGTTYGSGDGSTTFSLPDLRGEFVRGWDHSRGADSGRQLGSWQADEIKSHTHTLPLEAGGSSNNASLTDTANTDEGTYGTPATGATGGAETRPRNVALMFIIKA